MTRRENDFYPTPAALVDRIMDTCVPHLTGELVLEPSAGDGAFVRRLLTRDVDVVAVEPSRILATDMRGLYDSKKLHTYNDTLEAFAQAFPEPDYQLIIGNPPYSHAEAHVRLCLGLLEDGGQLTFLLRSGFLAHRKALFEAHPPQTVWMLHQRPSFCWSWSCARPLSPDENEMFSGGCGHKWTGPVGEKFATCPECGRAKPKSSRSDNSDYCVITWRQGFQGTTRLQWL